MQLMLFPHVVNAFIINAVVHMLTPIGTAVFHSFQRRDESSKLNYEDLKR